MVVGGQDQTARWLDVETSAVTRVYPGHGGLIHSVAITRDGRRIAVGSRDGTVRVWDAEP